MYSEPVILNEHFPLSDKKEIIDPDLVRVFDVWCELAKESKGLPEWSVDFGMRVPNVMSRTFLYDTSGEKVYISLIGETCREFIGIEKAKGPLDELMPEVNAKDVLNRIDKCATQHAPNYCMKSLSWSMGRDFVKYEAMFFPFVRKGEQDPTWFFSPLAFHTEE